MYCMLPIRAEVGFMQWITIQVTMVLFINASFGQATQVVHSYQSFFLFKISSPNNYSRYNYLIRPMSYNSQSISEVERAPHGSPADSSIALSHHGSKFPIIYLSVLQNKSSINPTNRLATL